MLATTEIENEVNIELTLRLLEHLIDKDLAPLVGVRLWNGRKWPTTSTAPVSLVLKHPGALRAMFLPGTELALAEAYIFDDFDIEGDIETVFDLATGLQKATGGWAKKLQVASELYRLPGVRKQRYSNRPAAHLNGRSHSVERDRQAVAYHYNVSNDFYRLWLDGQMVYSCAYFQSPEDDLDFAQKNKLDYICRKLRLKPGQKLLDLGCGWGGLVLHAARYYGVDVTGITLSQPQAQEVNARIGAAGLHQQARVVVQDYREVNDPDSYDAVVSVGMFEHVGKELLPTYFTQAYHLLKPGGVFLNHGIARGTDFHEVKGPTFIDSYVFPDGELVPIGTTVQLAQKAGFEVRDIESLREHYMLTIRQWVRRLEAQHREALQIVDEPTYRIWRLYLSSSAYGFKTNQLNLYQTLLLKPSRGGQSYFPLTRMDWYQREVE